METRTTAAEEGWRRDILMAHRGDTKLREEFINRNMGLVYMAARRFENRGVSREDLVQTGAIGLIKAVDHFDVTLPYAFSTYALPRIVGEIRRFLRDDSMIHISRSVKENAGKIASVRENIKKNENREPGIGELCQLTGLSKEDLIIAIGASKEVVSFSKSAFNEEASGTFVSFESELVDRLAISAIIEQLEPREQELIRLRFIENRTQAEAAESLGRSQVTVSRAERKLLIKLRHIFTAPVQKQNRRDASP